MNDRGILTALPGAENFLTVFFNRGFFINDYPAIIIAWNIFLAGIPVLLVLYLEKLWLGRKLGDFQQKIFFALIFFIWLIFAPNTAYIIADIRHLSGYCPADAYLKICPWNAWMIAFFYGYSLIGWLSFLYIVLKIETLIESLYNKKISKIFVNILVPLLALGVMLGLLDRWNSWEIFIYPLAVIKSVWKYFSNWNFFADWLSFYLLLYVSYFLAKFLKIKKLL